MTYNSRAAATELVYQQKKLRHPIDIADIVPFLEEAYARGKSDGAWNVSAYVSAKLHAWGEKMKKDTP